MIPNTFLKGHKQVREDGSFAQITFTSERAPFSKELVMLEPY
jgi:hypothetical protein